MKLQPRRWIHVEAERYFSASGETGRRATVCPAQPPRMGEAGIAAYDTLAAGALRAEAPRVGRPSSLAFS